MHIPIKVPVFVFLTSVTLFSQTLPTAVLTPSNPTFANELGTCAAMSGSTVAACDAGVIYVFTKPANAPGTDMTESARLLPGIPAASVAISGDANIIVAGCPQPNGSLGALYVFVKPQGGWKGTISPVALLQPGTPPKTWVLPGTVGYSVGIDSKGTTIVSGAYNAGTQGHLAQGKQVAGVPEQGAAYIWTEPAGGWSEAGNAPETAKLTASDGIAYDHFGFDVAISATTVVVGAPAVNNGLGAAYIYTRPARGIWLSTERFKSKFAASDGKTSDAFGTFVAAGNSGALVAIGTARGCTNLPGTAYVFVRPPSWWPASTKQTAELTPSDGSTGTCFGRLAVGDHVVFVSAPSAMQNAGDAYTFTKPVNGWTDLSSPPSMVGANGAVGFGISESNGGRSTAVGAPGTTVEGVVGAGAVYIFSN
jgi:hypothetical protein